MQGQVEARFSQHPDAEIIGSQPGLGPILGARVPGEFGDGPHRHTSDKARKNYAPTSPLTRQPGRRQTVIARYVHNDPLRDALDRQASAAPATSPRARAHHDQLRARGAGHNAALRQLAHRPAGTLHGCLKTRTPTTRRPPGPGTPSKKPSPRPDIQAPGMSPGTPALNRERSPSRAHFSWVWAPGG